ncbi:MAG TPA: VWA domain-containing protein [Pyrinomonadaceae bacterium]|nr:VWA domain-containing protein [Pyrinomonadaceae bacterium]
MKRVTFWLLCIGILVLPAIGQNDRSSRPRVAPNPQPVDPQVVQNDKAPVLQNDNGTGGDRRAPNLRNGMPGARDTQQSSTTSPQTSGEDEVVKVETNLVTMPVSVVDRDARFIAGLQQKDFKIFENGVEQKVDYFQSVEQPFTVVLMIDVSPSTAFQIDEIHEGAIAFVNQLRPDDKVMVIAFDDAVRVLCRPTNNRRVLYSAITQAQFGDGTSLYEAVDQVVNRELANIPGRKAVVLFTDGVDTTSQRATFESNVADVEEVDALFYPIRYNTQRTYGAARGGGGGYPRRRSRMDDWIGVILGGQIPMNGGGGGPGPLGSRPEDYATGMRFLETLAANTGGRKYEADSITNLDAAFAGIAEELRRQYSLGYYPTKPGEPGERRRINVRVTRPNVIVKAKNTYVFKNDQPNFSGN